MGKELIEDIKKKEIVASVEKRQKEIDKDSIRDDYEVYQAALQTIEKYKIAYRVNLVLPNGKATANAILKMPIGTNFKLIRNSYESKYRKQYPSEAKRADDILKPFDNLTNRIIKTDIPRLGNIYERHRTYRRATGSKAGNIGPNIDRVADRINEEEKKIRPNAQKEVSQQETQKLANESARTLAGGKGAGASGKEKVTPKKYMERRGDKFVFTKESNPVKIHEVMSAFIQQQPDAVFLLDYNGCIGNDSLKADIKRRTRNNSGKVYIKYNPKIKTYDFFDGTTKEPLGGKRPYIWEGVTMISKEVEGLVAQKQQQDRLDASTNINYTKLASNLEKNFAGQIKILQDIKLTKSVSFWDEIKGGRRGNETYPNRGRDYLVYIETRLNEVVKKWRTSARYDKRNPIDTGGGILQLRLITSTGDLTKVPLFVDDASVGAARGGLPAYLYKYISSRKSETQQYLTQRLYERWGELAHMERREADVGYEKQRLSTDEKERERQEKIIKEKKELKIYGMEKLWEVLDSLEKDSHMTKELGPLLTHIEGIKQSLEKSPKNSLPSNSTWITAMKETQDLYIKYKNHDGSLATITDAAAKKLIEQIFNAKSRTEVQNAASKLGNGMTFFDNTSRSGAVSDYFEDATEKNQSYYKNKGTDKKDLLEIKDKENKGYNECFQNICKLTYIDVNETTGEITGPKENINFIDSLMGCYTQSDLTKIFKEKNLIPEDLEKEDSKKYDEICTSILKTLDNKRDMERKFELTASDMKKSYEAEIDELKKKTTLTDEEMARMAMLMCIIEDDEGLKESAKEQTKIGKKAIRYGGIDSLLHEHISSYLVKKGGGLKGGNVNMSNIYNDSKGLRGRWDWTDENCEKIGPILKEILTEVVITAVAVGLGVVTGGLGTAAMATATATRGTRIVSIGNKVKNFTHIATLCKKMGAGARYCKKLKNTTKLKIRGKVKNTKFGNAYNRAREASHAKIAGGNIAKSTGRKLAEISMNTRAGRGVVRATEWMKGTKARKAGKTLGEIVKAGNFARKEGSLGMKAVGMIFEGTGFHVASTALHNAIEGRDILADLDPRYNLRGYVQSIAFIGMLRFLGKSINTMTNTGVEFVMGQKISATQFGNALKYIAGLSGEFGTLCATDQAISVGFGEGFKEMTTKDAIHSIGIILGLRLHGRIKQLKKITIMEYNKTRGELKADLGEGVVTLKEDEILSNNNGENDNNKGKSVGKGNESENGRQKQDVEGENNSSKEKIQKAEEELKGIRDKITGVEARIKRIDGQIKNFEASREISNRERLAKDISKRRTYSENGNKPSDNIPINDHYEGRIIDGKIEIIDKRTGKINTVEFDAKKRINDLLGNDKELEKLDIEIAERMILGIKNGHIEVRNIEEAVKIKNGYPDMNLEIVGLENGNYGVRKKTNIRKLRQQKAELDAQLKGLKSEHRKKRTALNKEKKSQDKDNIEQKVKEDKEKQTSVEQNGDGEVRGQEQRQERGRNEGNDKIDKSEDVERDLEQLVSRMKTGSYESIKLDWVSQKMFETGVFIEGVHRRFKNLSLKPNMKMSKEFLKKMRDGLVDMKNKWGEKLSEYHRKLVDKRNKFLERKLSENGDEVGIKEEEIKQLEEQEMRDNNIKDTDSPQEIADKLENSIENNADFEVGKEAFVSGRFIEGVHRRFKNLSLKPNMKMSKEFLKKMRDGLVDMKNKWGEKLSEYHRKLVDKRNKFLERKLSENGDEVGIKEEEIKQLEEQEMRDNNIKDTDSPQEIADKLENSIENNSNFEVGKEAFISGRFIEGIKNWFNKNIQRPNFSLPRDSIKRLKNKISEMMKNRGNELSDSYKKFMERFDRFLNDLLKQPREKIEIKKQQKSETKTQEYQLGQEVYVKRTAGGESKARVESYNPKTGEYIVRWNEGGRWLQKKVTSESLREIKNGEKLQGKRSPLKYGDVKLFNQGRRLEAGEKDVLEHFVSTKFMELRKESGVIAIAGDCLCIGLEGKTIFVKEQFYGDRKGGRPLNKVISVERRIPKDVCKKVLEAGNIFEMNGTKEMESYFNKIMIHE